MPDIPFISWIGHGAASLAPPGVFTGVKGYSFAIKADTGAMQRLTDALLNAASDGSVHYEAMVPFALFTFMDIARCTSGVDRIGWVPGRECGIWVPLVEWHHHHPWQTRPVFWSPYIFIDYTIGMLTGREVWGWPKVHARIGMDRDAGPASSFTCETMMFREMNPEQQGEHAELYRIVPSGPSGGAEPVWQRGAEAAEALAGRLFGGVGELAGDILGRLHVHPVLPSVALKQFRDAANAEVACFQAVVDSPAEITRFGGAGLLPHRYDVEIATCASHRIVQDFLGVQPAGASTILPVEWGAWVDMDFRAQPGRDIVRKSQGDAEA